MAKKSYGTVNALKKRLLYIMGIDWNWIYQRPQILTKMLSGDYEVTVVFPRSILSRDFRKPAVEGLDFRILWTLPYQERNGLIYKISGLINKKTFPDFRGYDVVWIGYPHFFRYLPDDLTCPVIYDCMDDHEALYPDRKNVRKVTMQEEALVKRCDSLIVSSEVLRKKMDGIAGKNKSILIRNGASDDLLREAASGRLQENEGNSAPAAQSRAGLENTKGDGARDIYRLAYIGTISEWFDLPLLKKSLDELPDFEYRLIGPAVRKEELEGIVYRGPVDHTELSKEIEDCDCLIMPFRVNSVVEAVDPVKLYEYIAFGKCIISVYYKEIERFSEFVYFYHDEEEYLSLLQTLRETGFQPKYSPQQQKRFLAENTWEKRYEAVLDVLHQCGV